MNRNDMPLVSVIVACHNCENYLDDCISSLVNQTYKNIEIIICDDASTDDSVKVIKKWMKQDERIILITNDHCKRAAASRNRCIEKATGDYYLIQDADDYSELNRVEFQLSHLMNSQYDFISSASFLFSTDKNVYDAVLCMHCSTPKKKDFLWGLPFIHAATLFRASCINSVNGYREAKETKRGQDYDLFMRLYANGYCGINNSVPLYWIRADRNYYKRMALSSAVDEFLIRYKGFKRMGLLPFGFIFTLKPFASSIYHLLLNQISNK